MGTDAVTATGSVFSADVGDKNRAIIVKDWIKRAGSPRRVYARFKGIGARLSEYSNHFERLSSRFPYQAINGLAIRNLLPTALGEGGRVKG